MNTRPCVCQGSNENCRYCAGRGCVESGTGLPGSIGRKKLAINDGWQERERRPTMSCPICGASVTKLKRHLNRKHGGIKQGTLISSVGEEPAISPAIKIPITNRQLDPKPFEQTKLPPDANTATAHASQLSGDPKPPAGGVRCPRCLVLFDGREALRNHLRGNCSAASLKIKPQVALTRCPGCGTSVKHSRLQKHLASKCPARLVGKSRKDATGGTATPTRHVRNPIAKKPSPGSTWAEVNSIDRLDRTKGYAHPCRESGKYGSHSMHDGFDDESGPD
jgi:hypothetical protein